MPQFSCPQEYVAQVKSVWDGEFDMPGFVLNPRICDIGSGVGEFIRWVYELKGNQHYKDPVVFAYEPSSKLAAFVTQNCSAYPRFTYTQAAVVSGDVGANETRTFYIGKSLGKGSLTLGAGQNADETEKVKVVSAKDLPKDLYMLRIDAPYAEADILKTYLREAKDSLPKQIAFVWYGDKNRVACDLQLLSSGYVLHRTNVGKPGVGASFYLHKTAIFDALKKEYEEP